MLQLAREMKQPPGLFSAPGFKWEFVTVDSMHACDLGCFQDAIGGLMFVEIAQKSWHASYKEGIDFLNDQLDGFYAANPGCSEVELSLPMIKAPDGSHPTLKCKAAACRHLAPFALYLANRHSRHNLEFDDVRLRPYSAEYRTLAVRMARAIVDYHETCACEPFSPQQCRAAMDAFLEAYCGLRLLFRRGLPAELHQAQAFPPRPKMHAADHICREKVPMYGSPRLFWCYADEDFVGLVKRIAMQTKHPRSIEWVLVCKYRLYTTLLQWELEECEP